MFALGGGEGEAGGRADPTVKSLSKPLKSARQILRDQKARMIIRAGTQHHSWTSYCSKHNLTWNLPIARLIEVRMRCSADSGGACFGFMLDVIQWMRPVVSTMTLPLQPRSPQRSAIYVTRCGVPRLNTQRCDPNHYWMV